jgi:hypothetical protein
MLYDREDRMSRPIFLTEYDIEGSTEKRARGGGIALAALCRDGWSRVLLKAVGGSLV